MVLQTHCHSFTRYMLLQLVHAKMKFCRQFTSTISVACVALWVSWLQWLSSTSPPVLQCKEEAYRPHFGVLLCLWKHWELFKEHSAKGIGKFTSCRAQCSMLYSVLYKWGPLHQIGHPEASNQALPQEAYYSSEHAWITEQTTALCTSTRTG